MVLPVQGPQASAERGSARVGTQALVGELNGDLLPSALEIGIKKKSKIKRLAACVSGPGGVALTILFERHSPNEAY